MRRPNRLVRSSAAILVAGAIATGCGSDLEETTAPSTTPASAPAAGTTTGASPAATSESPAVTDPQVEPRETTAASTTEPAATPAGTESGQCRRLTDFDGDDTGDWFVVDDGVMGGRSNGEIEITDSTLRFSGSVVTRGGGFTSVRLRLSGDELAGTSRVDLRVRADRRTYGLTFEDDAVAGQRSVSHRADLEIADGQDGWAVATLPYGELVPSVFGLLVDADPFDPDEAREIGIIISDGLDGDFALDVDWIDACP